jgi:hypothetical protein
MSSPGKFASDYAGPIGRPPPPVMNNHKNAHYLMALSDALSSSEHRKYRVSEELTTGKRHKSALLLPQQFWRIDSK